MTDVNKTVELICEQLPSRKRLLISIDGRCGSGKTTLAEALGRKLGCTVIHMDDFFLRPQQRTQERLDKAGENVDHERFLAEVLAPLSQGKSFSFRPFDCSRMVLGQPILVDPTPITIVEGTYSGHPALWDKYHLHIFMDIAPEEQLARLEKRDPARLSDFQNKWIPLEEQYFAAYKIKERSDIVVK